MKKIIRNLLIFAIAVSIHVSIPTELTYADTLQNSIEITPYVEVTTWYFRNTAKGKQKRLWSITYGKWLTDWIDVK